MMMKLKGFLHGRKATSSESQTQKQSSSQGVAAGVFQINTAVATFAHIVDSIGTAKDTPNLREKLHKTRLHIVELVKDTSAKLKILNESDNDAPANQRVANAKLAKDFHAILRQFQKLQSRATELETTVATTSSDKQDLESQPFLSEEKRQELPLSDNEVSVNESTDEEKVVKDIQEGFENLRVIFEDLAFLAQEQGLTIDDIFSDNQASSSTAATNEAQQQISKASGTEKAGFKWVSYEASKTSLILSSHVNVKNPSSCCGSPHYCQSLL